MRKQRNWFMGLGIGIMLGASMLQLIHFAQSQDDALKKAEQGVTYTRKQLEEEVAKAVEAERMKAGASPSRGASSPSSAPPSPSEPAPASPSAAPSASASSSPEAKKELSFYVSQGMDLTRVARSLKRLGLIDDADDFTDEARTVSKKIQPGTARFTGKPTYEEIIAELTRVKDD